MAELLAHPDKDRDFSKRVYPLRIGIVSLKTYNGEPMTDSAAVLLLEQARLIVVDQSLEA